ncbi:hypothetical protein Ancab_035414 [Ancistrocladus abbreviatus]
MAKTLEIPKSSCHARSISLPSRPHPADAGVEGQLSKLRNSTEASCSAWSICHNLCGIKDLYERVNDFIQLPLNQQAVCHELHHYAIEEALDDSLGLLDLCGSAADAVSEMKQSILELQTSLRRSVGGMGLENYIVSRKKIKKMLSKCFANLKKVENTCTMSQLDKEGNPVSSVRMLRDAEVVSLLGLKSILVFVSGTKVGVGRRGWSLVAKLMQSKHASCETDSEANEVEKIDRALYYMASKKMSVDRKTLQNLLKQLESLESTVSELEDGLVLVSRCLLKTRISLLNAVNH